MIVTDKFVFLHFPKTGGLSATDMLQRLYQQKSPFIRPEACQELMMPNVKRINGGHILNPHGTYDQIPPEHLGKVIVSSIRNPFDRYVSTYEFRMWTKREPAEMDGIMQAFPTFPDLTFAQYVEFANIYEIANRTYSSLLRLNIGLITYTFIQFFFKDPKRVIENLDEAYLRSDRYKEDMADVTFLHAENLNGELHDFLRSLSYADDDIAFIRDAKRVNVTAERKAKDWRTYYNRELFDDIKFRERFLFRVFPEYNESF